MNADQDVTDPLAGWTPREMAVTDTPGPAVVREFLALLDEEPGDPRPGDPLPLGLHWCIAKDVVPTASLGEDGHPHRGGFLPPVPLPRRMWAGGEITFLDPLRLGDALRRVSRVGDVAWKEGRSGRLCFVTVHHAYATERGIAIRERQDIVYREASSGAATAGPPAAPPAAPTLSRTLDPTPALLFRYSAVTFNAHRIHYDRAYAATEGYPGLVVHGPLQATLLMRLAARLRGRPPAVFSYRGVAPLFEGTPFVVAAREREDGSAEGWTAAVGGGVGMRAEARWTA